MAKDDDRTNKPEEAGKWGTAGKTSGKNNKNGKGKEYKTDRRIDKVLQLAADRIDTIDSSASVPERLARAAKSSELLSAVWSLPPAQRLMFHHGMQVTDVEGDSTPGFDGNKEDAEEFISISSSEIARYQRLMYANGVKGSTRRLLIVLQGMDASGKGGIVRHVFSQGDPMGIHYHGFGKPAAEELDHDFLWRVKRPRRGGLPYSTVPIMKMWSCRTSMAPIPKTYGVPATTRSTISNVNWPPADAPSSRSSSW